MAKTNGNTNAKRNTMIVISTIMSFLLFAIAIGLFVYAKYAVNTNVGQNEKGYKIVVNADVTAYEGDEQLLTPHIVAADGSVVPGRFTYEVVDADSAPITVSESGGVSVKEDGDAAEGRIKITELNTQTEVVVSIKVERKLSGIKGVVFGENLVVATETQELTFGDEYIVTVKTTPSQAVLKSEQLSIKTVDRYGKEIQGVLDYSVVPNTNKVKIRPIGLGTGSMVFSVVADGKELCKDEEYKFDVSMFDEVLHDELVTLLKNSITEDKVEQTKIELISANDIAKVSTISISDNVQSLHGVNTELFPALDTVIFPLGDVKELTDDVVCSDICYRVDKKLFDNYVQHEFWHDYVYSLIPYEKNALTEKWVVFHGYDEPYDGCVPRLTCQQVRDEFEFENFDDKGCKNDYFYTGKDPKPQTIEDKEQIKSVVKQQVSLLAKNGVHIEVGYTPNKYSITYVIQEDAAAGWQEIRVTDNAWIYGESRKLYSSDDIIDPNTQQAIKKTGYELTGWRLNDGFTVLNVDDMQVNLVQSGSLRLTANWTPISYTIIYLDDETGDTIDVESRHYDAKIPFRNLEKTGYTLENYVDKAGNIYEKGKSYDDVMTEPGIFYLNVHYRENIYNVHLDAGSYNGTQAGFMNLTAGRDFTVTYTQQFRLPVLNHPDSSSYKWEGRDSAGNKITGMSFIPEAQISMLSDVDGANITLRGTWAPTTYHIVYDLKGFSYTYKEYSEGKLVTKTTTTKYNQERSLDDGLAVINPNRTGYTALRWKVSYYTDATSSTHKTPQIKYYYFGDTNDLLDAISTANRKQVDGRTYYLELEYKANIYTVTYDYNGATEGGDATKSVTYDQAYGELPVPKRLGTDPMWLGYSFEGWYNESGQEITKNTIMNMVTDHKLIAQWKAQPLTVTITDKPNDLKDIGSSEAVTVTVTGGSGNYSFSTPTCSNSNATCGFDSETGKLTVTAKKEGKSGKVTMTVTDNVYGSKAFISKDWSTSSCVTAGTLITLADGTNKAVEDLQGDELLLVWNLITGSFEAAPILCIDSDPADIYEVINLHFSDGTIVKVVSEHGFYDITLNKYVYLDKNATQYIGHWFNKQIYANEGMDYTQVQLIEVNIANEYTTTYSPVTYAHFCIYVNGMLSMPGGIDGLFNIFDVDPETMQYDLEAMEADIRTYGLYTHEELSALIPISAELFDAVSAQYLKVAVGKGLITIDGLRDLFERYMDLLVDF